MGIPGVGGGQVFEVASEVAQLALTVVEGDIVVRSDESKSYAALNSLNVSIAADWLELKAVGGGGGGNETVFFYVTQTNTSFGDYRVLSTTTGNINYVFRIPDNFVSLVKLVAIVVPTAGAATSGQDIDLSSDYAANDEVFNNHSESDTGTLYDFTGKTDTFVEIDGSIVFSSLAAGDMCGFKVQGVVVGGSMRHFGVLLEYSK